MTSYAVRPARPADADRLAAVHVAVWREAYVGLMPAEHLAGLSADVFAARWRTILQAEARDEADGARGRRTVVLTADGEPVGFATAGPSRDDPPDPADELYSIYVLSEHRGGARADHLLTRALEAAGAGPALSLWVLRGNARARGFYRRNGFAPDGTTKEHPPATVPVERWVRAARLRVSPDQNP
jgi:ribosomal protein S18 acetylase RimI-like enzyme